MPRYKEPELRFPLKLTLAQRNAIAEFAPAFKDRLKLDEPDQRIAAFSVAELKKIKQKAEAAFHKASGYERRPLKHILKTTSQALDKSQRVPASEQIYQFKITLLESQPPIWRRIQVKDCTLDKLHEHTIEAATQRIGKRHGSAEEPVTARIRRRMETVLASVPSANADDQRK